MLPKNVEDILALTPMQRMMLLHVVTNPDPRALSNQVVYDIRGSLDVDRFREAWVALIARHPSLRTAFLWEGLERPVQVVRGRTGASLSEIDLSAEEDEAQRVKLDEIRAADADQPFDLGKAPLMRGTLVRRGRDAHQLIWSLHHLIVDRWSQGVLVSDLAHLYRSLENGSPSLPAPVAFRDYVAWLGRQDEAETERFWRSELAGLSTGSIPHVRRGPQPGQARTTLRATLSREVTAALQRRASSWKVTLASLVLAAVAVETMRRRQASDVICGMTVSGRPPDLVGVEHAVGSFVNNVAVRVRVDGNRPLSDWVRDLRTGQVRRQRFEHASPAAIHDWTDLPASQPLFDLLAVLNLDTPTEGDWGGLTFTPVTATLEAAYPRVLGVRFEDSSLGLALVHDADDADAERVLAGLEAALEAIARADDAATVYDLVPIKSFALSKPPSPTPSEVEGRTADLQDRLLALWREVLGVDVGLDDDFFVLGGTSIQAALIFNRIERVTGRTLPLSTLVRSRSVRALLAELDEPTQRSGNVVALRSRGARRKMFAVPGIDGNVIGLFPLARALGSEQPFFGLESRGLDGNAEPHATIEEIAVDFVDQVLAGHEGGVHLLGACWGATVAFEMARILETRGAPPRSLSLLDPAVVLRENPAAAPNSRATFVRDRLRLYWDEFMGGDWQDRGTMIAQKAHLALRMLRSGGVTAGGQLGLSQQKVRDMNRHAVMQYRPAALRTPARVFITEDRDLGDIEDPRLAWVDLIEPTPLVVRVAGSDSGDALTANVGEFAAALRSWIDEADAHIT